MRSSRVVQRLLVLGEPLVHRTEARRFEAVQPPASIRPRPDEPHFAQHAKVLRDLGLRHRQVVDDRPDGLLAADEHVEDRAPGRLGDRVEHICRRS